MEKDVQELIGVSSPIQKVFLKEGLSEIEGKSEHLSYTKEIPIKSKNRPVPYLQKISQTFGKILRK
jgi:hypothetical protein